MFGAKTLAGKVYRDAVYFSRPRFSRNKATVYCVESRGLFFLRDKHVVLVGELKMPACGLCKAAYKKAALVVKRVCLHKSFSILHPLLSFCFTFSILLSITSSSLSETLNPSRRLPKIQILALLSVIP